MSNLIVFANMAVSPQHKFTQYAGYSQTVVSSAISTLAGINRSSWDGANLITIGKIGTIDAYKCWKFAGFSGTLQESFQNIGYNNDGGIASHGGFTYTVRADAQKVYKYNGFTSTLVSSVSTNRGYSAIGFYGDDMVLTYIASPSRIVRFSGFSADIKDSFSGDNTPNESTAENFDGDIVTEKQTSSPGETRRYRGFSGTLNSTYSDYVFYESSGSFVGATNTGVGTTTSTSTTSSTSTTQTTSTSTTSSTSTTQSTSTSTTITTSTSSSTSTSTTVFGLGTPEPESNPKGSENVLAGPEADSRPRTSEPAGSTPDRGEILNEW